MSKPRPSPEHILLHVKSLQQKVCTKEMREMEKNDIGKFIEILERDYNQIKILYPTLYHSIILEKEKFDLNMFGYMLSQYSSMINNDKNVDQLNSEVSETVAQKFIPEEMRDRNKEKELKKKMDDGWTPESESKKMNFN
tara:strand:- start:196 stop:612 length:417 start_codon:yes stop_codon:yes gene_type:complete